MALGVGTTYPEISPSPGFSSLCEEGIHSFRLDLGTLVVLLSAKKLLAFFLQHVLQSSRLWSVL